MRSYNNERIEEKEDLPPAKTSLISGIKCRWKRFVYDHIACPETQFVNSFQSKTEFEEFCISYNRLWAECVRSVLSHRTLELNN
jgi:hypothetical protein